MLRQALLCLVLALGLIASAWGRAHEVSFGDPMKVELFVGPRESDTRPMTIRTLLVDRKVKEFVTGAEHDLSGDLFAVQRVYRVSESRHEEPKSGQRWKWMRGDWITVKRSTGQITRLQMPDFDPYFSLVSWHGNYFAYCGSDDGERLLGVVRRLNRSESLGRAALGRVKNLPEPDSECQAPQWETVGALHVTFQPKDGPSVSQVITDESHAPSGPNH